MARAGSVEVDLLLKNARFLEDARRSANAMRNIDRRANQVARTFRTLRNVIGVAIFARMAASSVRLSTEIFNLSKRLNVGIEELQELRDVADQNNISFNTLTTALQRAARRAAEAARGTGEAKDAFRELNVSAAEFASLSAGQQLETLAEALSGVEATADRVRIAMKVLDTEGVAVLQAFEDGAAGVRNTRDEFRQLGGVISGQSVKALAQLGDSASRFISIIVAGSSELLGRFAPALTEVADIATRLAGSAFRTLNALISQTAASIARFQAAVVGGVIANAQSLFGDDDAAERSAELSRELNRLADSYENQARAASEAGANNAGVGRTFSAFGADAKEASKGVDEVANAINRMQREIAGLRAGDGGESFDFAQLVGRNEGARERLTAIREILLEERALEESRKRAAEAQRRRDEQITESLRRQEEERKRIVERNNAEIRRAVGNVAQDMADSFARFALDAQFSFRNLVDDILQQIVRLLANRATQQFAQVVSGAVGGGSGGGSGGGGFADLVSTAFGAFASSQSTGGTGAFGSTAAGGLDFSVNINNESGSFVSANRNRGIGGVNGLDITIAESVNRGLSVGAFDSGLGSTFGLQRSGVTR